MLTMSVPNNANAVGKATQEDEGNIQCVPQGIEEGHSPW